MPYTPYMKARFLRFSLASCLLGGMILITAVGGSMIPARAPASTIPLALKAVGTQILNSENKPVLLRGVNAASLEWTSDGEGHILQSVNTAIKDWHVNIIRLPSRKIGGSEKGQSRRMREWLTGRW